MASARSGSRLPLVAALVAGVLLIALVRLFAGGGNDDDPAAAPPSAASAPSGAAASARAGCLRLTVAASSEKAALMGQIAGRYGRTAPTVDGTCVDVRVVSKASGGAEAALARGWDAAVDGPRPDVWSPAASTWVSILRQDLASKDRTDITPEKSESVTSTPLVLAMPQPMAEALGWPKAKLGWSDVLRLGQDPRGWASKGHPEWGRFTLGKTNPNLSTSGLAATIGAFVAATGRSSDLRPADLADPKVTTFVAGVESAVVHYGDTTLTFLSNLQSADDQGRSLGYVSAVAVEEKSVLDYNNGNPTGDPATLGRHPKPKVPLVAIYPKEGTLTSDSPYVVLDAPWVDAARKKAAADFFAYLRRPEEQRTFGVAGFRTFDGRATDVIRASSALLADQPAVVLGAPSPQVLEGVRATWEKVRKRARVLLLLDVSGSMGDPVGTAGTTRLELAKTAAAKAVKAFADNDEVGLWVFTSDLPTRERVYADLVPVGPVGPHRAELAKAIAGLTPLNGTPLYAATRRAVAVMDGTVDPSKINAVVLLTDGRNEYPQDTDLDGLVSDLSRGSAESGVRVFSIAYGQDADLKTLKRISEASRAAAYDATTATDIDTIFTTVISNF